MGVGFESNVLVLLIVLSVIAGFVALGRALWEPVLSRLWAYFMAWWERDARREREARIEADCRRRAEREVKAMLTCEDTAAAAATRAAPPQTAAATPPAAEEEEKEQKVLQR